MKRLTEDKARADLKRWLRKLSLAKTKVKRLRRAVRRFDKIAAAHGELLAAIREDE